MKLKREEKMSSSKVTTKEEVWEILAETSRKIQENSDKMKESSAETDRKIQETSDKIQELSTKTDQITRELSVKTQKNKKELKNSEESNEHVSDFFETEWERFLKKLTQGDLAKILQDKNINVQRIFPRVTDHSEKTRCQYDIIADNLKEIVVVEVRSDLRVEDVRYFLEKLKKISHRISIFKERIVYGAVAYLRASKRSKVYAEKQGLFVIRATGSSASLINKEDFKPKKIS